MTRKGKHALIMDADRAALTPPGVLYHYSDIYEMFDEAFAVSAAE